MPSEQLQSIVEVLRANPVLDGTVAERRARMEAMTAASVLPDGTTVELVDAGGVPAEWVVAPDASPDATASGDPSRDRTLVYLHGGGYTIGSPASHRRLAALLSAAAGARVLLVDYRLAPEHPHPAAVHDATAAYSWLLDQGIRPAHVAIGGDSAGGGLTVAALVALRDEAVPLPAAAVVLSPWTDLECTGESATTKAHLDPLCTPDGLKLCADEYLAGQPARLPLASPLYADLRGLPPLLVQAGTAEILLDDATRLAERASAAGVDVTLDVWDDMIHVFQAFAGLVPEADEAVERIGAYLRSKVPAAP